MIDVGIYFIVRFWGFYILWDNEGESDLPEYIYEYVSSSAGHHWVLLAAKFESNSAQGRRET